MIVIYVNKDKVSNWEVYESNRIVYIISPTDYRKNKEKFISRHKRHFNINKIGVVLRLPWYAIREKFRPVYCFEGTSIIEDKDYFFLYKIYVK